MALGNGQMDASARGGGNHLATEECQTRGSFLFMDPWAGEREGLVVERNWNKAEKSTSTETTYKEISGDVGEMPQLKLLIIRPPSRGAWARNADICLSMASLEWTAWVRDNNSLQKVAVNGSAPSLVWGGQLPLMRLAKQSLIIACG